MVGATRIELEVFPLISTRVASFRVLFAINKINSLGTGCLTFLPASGQVPPSWGPVDMAGNIRDDAEETIASIEAIIVNLDAVLACHPDE